MPSGRWNMDDYVVGWWIKISEHKDIKKDGYISVSSLPYSKLRHQIKKWSRSHLESFIKDHWDNIEFIPIIAGKRRDVLKWRKHLRPTEHIGLVHTHSECLPPLATKGMHTEEFKKNQSDRMLKNNPMFCEDTKKKHKHNTGIRGDVIVKKTGAIIFEDVKAQDIQFVLGIEKRRLMRWKNIKHTDFFLVRT